MVSEEIITIRKELELNGKNGLALDIDETLSWTIGHWVKEMQILFGNEENLSIKEMIEKYRYTQNVPYWQSEEAKKWVEDSINNNELQKEFKLVNGANEYVNMLHKIIPFSCYITTRPESVKSGTEEWLETNGFPRLPIIARAPGVLKSEGNKWKAEILDYLYPYVAGIVDDNAGLLDNLPLGYQGKIFLFSNKVIPKTTLNAFACSTWKDTYKKIIKYWDNL